MKRLLLLAMLLLFSVAHGQNLPGTKLKIKKFDGEIVLDGVLNEQAWKEANIADNWYQNFPVYSLPAPFQTEARINLSRSEQLTDRQQVPLHFGLDHIELSLDYFCHGHPQEGPVARF